VWVAALVPVSLVCLLVLASVAAYGVREYMVDAKEVEAKTTLIGLGQGNFEMRGTGPFAALQLTGPRRPRVRPGQEIPVYSQRLERACHTCAGFSLTEPQYFISVDPAHRE